MNTRYVLQVRRYEGVDYDAHGNIIQVWGDPQVWPVYGFAPGPRSDVSDRTREEMTRIAWTVYAPNTAAGPGERDLVILNGDEYDVEGRPAPYDEGNPWPPHPTAGVVVELHRVEG